MGSRRFIVGHKNVYEVLGACPSCGELWVNHGNLC